jgi:hypothetical protein
VCCRISSGFGSASKSKISLVTSLKDVDLTGRLFGVDFLGLFNEGVSCCIFCILFVDFGGRDGSGNGKGEGGRGMVDVSVYGAAALDSRDGLDSGFS